MPLISAIVLNYRTPKDAWACVTSLLQQTVAKEMEILVVDNHSEDDSIGYLRNRARTHPSVRIIESSVNRGYGQGNDLAISQATGEFLLIINPDNTLEPESVERMIETLRSDSSIGIVAPALIHDDGTIRDSHRSFPTPLDVFIKRTALRHLFPERLHRYLHRNQPSSEKSLQDVDWVVGACLMLRTSFYRELGGFDPRFFLFFEDTDFCRRASEAGKRIVYLPDIRAKDRKKRLSEGGILSLFTKKTARIHLWSAVQYFWKYR